MEGHRQLQKGQCDLLLSPVAAEFDGLFRRRLIEDRYVCVLDPSNPLASGPLSFEDYAAAAHVFISYEGTWRPSYRDLIEARDRAAHGHRPAEFRRDRPADRRHRSGGHGHQADRGGFWRRAGDPAGALRQPHPDPPVLDHAHASLARAWLAARSRGRRGRAAGARGRSSVSRARRRRSATDAPARSPP
jgi:hypothetical protein